MKSALITGAMGGIGSVTCRVFRDAGYNVLAVDRRAGEFEGGHAIRFDIRDLHQRPDAAPEFLDRVRDLIDGKLDVLVNNAAIQIVKPVDDLDVSDWDVTMETNLIAPFLLIKALLPELRAATGTVINVASIHAVATKPGFVAYATSKGALVALTRALAVELSPGVRVNAVIPAATDTPMLRAGFEGDPAGFEELGAMHPMGRIAAPEEVANVELFLAGDQATFITGSALHVDGGIGARLHDPA
jgi:NAD(P)-dependent dehydrogenase (short-subunit alcohol dehydrogenase family)